MIDFFKKYYIPFINKLTDVRKSPRTPLPLIGKKEIGGQNLPAKVDHAVKPGHMIISISKIVGFKPGRQFQVTFSFSYNSK